MTSDACKQYTERLVDFVDDELSDDQCAVVESHLSQCAACRALAERLRESLELAHIVWTDAADSPHDVVRPLSATPQPETVRPRRLAPMVVRLSVLTAAAGILISIAWRLLSEPSQVVTQSKGRIAVAEPAPVTDPSEPTIAELDVESFLRHYEQAARLRAAVRILEETPELAVVERRARFYLDEHYADTGG